VLAERASILGTVSCPLVLAASPLPLAVGRARRAPSAGFRLDRGSFEGGGPVAAGKLGAGTADAQHGHSDEGLG